MSANIKSLFFSIVLHLSLFVSWGANTELFAASKKDMTPWHSAIQYFNKQAKLKPYDIDDKEYHWNLSPKMDEEKQLWGFVNEKGKYVIKPIFQAVDTFFVDSCALVNFQGFWGVIDKSCSFSCPPIFSSINRTSINNILRADCPTSLWWEMSNRNFEDHKLVVKKIDIFVDKEHLYVKSKGGLLTDVHFDDTQDFDVNNRAIVRTAEGYGLIDTLGAFIFKPQVDNIENFGDSNLYQIKDHGSLGLISKDGETILAAEYSRMDAWAAEDLIWINEKKSGKWGAIDQNGKIVVKCMLDRWELLPHNSQVVVTSDNRYGILRGDGYFLKECADDYIVKIDTVFWVIKSPGNIGVYQLTGTGTNYVQLPSIITENNEPFDIVDDYRKKHLADFDNRLWLKGLSNSTYYSFEKDSLESSLYFSSRGRQYVLRMDWADSVRLSVRPVTANLWTNLTIDKHVGVFEGPNLGRLGELASNEFVIGTYDIDQDGTEELVLLMRDNSRALDNKITGVCCNYYKLDAMGYWNHVGSELLSQGFASSAYIENDKIKVRRGKDSVRAFNRPTAENFGLKGDVMTAGDLSFDKEGYLSAIGDFNIVLGPDSNLVATAKPNMKGMKSVSLLSYDTDEIQISYESGGTHKGETPDTYYCTWTFNRKGLLESYVFEGPQGKKYRYFLYDYLGYQYINIELSADTETVTRYQQEDDTLDEKGNWISREASVQSSNGTVPPVQKFDRKVEYQPGLTWEKLY